MRRREGSSLALTVGEVVLPDGRMPRVRSMFLRRSLSIAALLGLAVALAIPLALVRASLRVEPTDMSLTTLDASYPGPDGLIAVAAAQRRLRGTPDDPRAMAGLALAYLQRVRETADPTYYAKADQLVTRAKAQAADDPTVRIAEASLALGRHDPAAALISAHAAVERAPRVPAAHAVLVDALVELGRYDEAVSAAQFMVDLRPDQASLSRVSYLRELYGDMPGAVDAMARAVQAGAPQGEGTAWSEVQVGHLLFATGDLSGAESAYDRAAQRIEGYAPALAGLARVHAARGDLRGAAALYESVVRTLPLPEHLAALGDVYARLGDGARAEAQYALVAATQRLFAANGARVDVDLALFDLDHDRDTGAALTAARTERTVRASVHVSAALAWAELKAGHLADAVRYSDEALRLGTSDPLLLYRAGVIADAAGQPERARDLLARAASLNGDFSVLFAPDLRARLGRLGAP